MSMLEWAKKEVELACKRENPDRKDGEWDYGCACYESALKAFKSLLEDEHSGYSIGLTKNILVRLIEGKVLTPIEDTPDIWNECHRPVNKEGCVGYQCARMGSLFKDVYPDGTVKYHDIDRTRVTYANNPDVWWCNGQASRIIDEMFPIAMPYCPTTKPYIVHAEEFLVDPANGDYDTVGYLHAIAPDGEKVMINRYFKDAPGTKMVEIELEEYLERKLAAANREEENDG